LICQLINATHNQAKQINDLVNLAYRSEDGWSNETHLVAGERSTIEEVHAYLANPNTYLLVALEQDKIIACICIEQKASDAYIGYFAVHPAYQGYGLGKQVLFQAEQFAREVFTVDSFVMVVMSQRPELIAYYERRGYKKTGRVLDYPKHLNVGTPLSNNLTIEYLQKNA